LKQCGLGLTLFFSLGLFISKPYNSIFKDNFDMDSTDKKCNVPVGREKIPARAVAG
jgi:hypothetical protein